MLEALARAEAAGMVNDWSEAALAEWVSSASASHDAMRILGSGRRRMGGSSARTAAATSAAELPHADMLLLLLLLLLFLTTCTWLIILVTTPDSPSTRCTNATMPTPGASQGNRVGGNHL